MIFVTSQTRKGRLLKYQLKYSFFIPLAAQGMCWNTHINGWLPSVGWAYSKDGFAQMGTSKIARNTQIWVGKISHVTPRHIPSCEAWSTNNWSIPGNDQVNWAVSVLDEPQLDEARSMMRMKKRASRKRCHGLSKPGIRSHLTLRLCTDGRLWCPCYRRRGQPAQGCQCCPFEWL